MMNQMTVNQQTKHEINKNKLETSVLYIKDKWLKKAVHAIP